jgi:N-acetylmuramoyl-L-alanine amidase
VSLSPSPNHGERRGGVRPTLIVLHYTGMATCAEARARLCDPVAEVSAHWLISETGEAEALVPEDRRAWHAGEGAWRGVSDVNSASIGIELANPGDRPFPEAQMAALEQVLRGVMGRWGIRALGVIAHSDMAPTRKSDPGARFDWQRLALQGLAVWAAPAEPADIWADLRRFGYPQGPEEALLAAFRLRFRPWGRGAVTDEDRRLAAGLAALG